MRTQYVTTYWTLLLACTTFCANLGSAQTPASRADITEKEVRFYSEGVLCYGKLFLPNGYSETSKVAAVVLAPGERQVSTSLDRYAAEFAAHGMLALTFDYRGVGKSGGFLYFAEPLRFDDRLRFSQTTTKMRVVRKRVIPQAQVLDIRNAITFVQGEAGVDRARIGIWGTDLSGGHAITVAGSDARVKALVAQAPMLAGKDLPRAAFAPTPAQQAAMVKLARTGAASVSPAAAMTLYNDESKLAFAEYHPFWFLDQIPATTALRFVVTAKDRKDADAAAKLLKGPNDVVAVPETESSKGLDAATDWFAKNL